MELQLIKKTEADGSIMFFVQKGIEVVHGSRDREEAVKMYEAAKSGYPKREVLMSETLPDKTKITDELVQYHTPKV